MSKKKYYTEEELDKDINVFIKESADELIYELKEKRKVNINKEVYV